MAVFRFLVALLTAFYLIQRCSPPLAGVFAGESERVGTRGNGLTHWGIQTNHRMQDAGIIDGYIVPCYDVLHTFSKEYIVDDLVDFMQKKGALQ